VDGATRLNTPIKPAIDLGAERIAVIAAASVSPPRRHAGRHDAEEPDFAVTAGLLLHGALSDPLIEDLRRLGDINSYYAQRSQAPAAVRERRAHGRPPYRRIPYVLIAPREPDAIGRLATECFHSRYGGLRALRSPDLFALGRLLGGDGSAHGELLSYLLFDPEFIRGLVELGREDAKAWLELGNGADGPWQQEPLDTLRPTGVAA
jgi:NTE family protein